MRLINKHHGCCIMFLFTSGRMICVTGLLKNVYTPLDLYPIILRHKKCVKTLLKKTHIIWVISLITLKQKKFASRLLKMNQKPWNKYQNILRQKRCVLRQCTGNHKPCRMSLKILRHRKCVSGLLKKTHDGFTAFMFLIILKLKRCATRPLKMNQKP